MPTKTNLKKVNRYSTSATDTVSTNFKPLNLVFLLSLLFLSAVDNARGQDHEVRIPSGTSEDGERGKQDETGDGKWYTKMISDSGVVQMGQVDLEDIPITGLSDDQALGLLFQR